MSPPKSGNGARKTVNVSIPLLDLKQQYRNLKPEIDAAVARVLDSTQFILGEEVRAFEAEVASYCGVSHAIGVASGTDALLLALRALDVGPGDRVLVPTFTFFATAGTVCNVGATPVFVDIDPETYNLDPDALAATLRDPEVCATAKAVVPVHLYGQPCDMDPILAIARKHGLAVIEDAAQAIGAREKGKQAGTIGDIGCFSFFPSKNLGAYGDGGMATTHDDALAEKLRILRVHGSKPKYHHHAVGYNSRLDALQAAILRAKLPYLDDWSRARRERAGWYDARLSGVKAEHLKAKGIGTSVYYPLPLHLQPCFAELAYREGDLPHAERASREVLSLPIFPELGKNEVETVCNAVEECLA